ncbi:hypothetical protein Mapa_011665 [Marchantia paleacea]|nr:hypothetical protein Mapa_011665 [Marchantia paleacea]
MKVRLVADCAPSWIKSAQKIGPPLDSASMSFFTLASRATAASSPRFSGRSSSKMIDPLDPPVLLSLLKVRASFNANLMRSGTRAWLSLTATRSFSFTDARNSPLWNLCVRSAASAFTAAPLGSNAEPSAKPSVSASLLSTPTTAFRSCCSCSCPLF